jgi:hypothetical protein
MPSSRGPISPAGFAVGVKGDSQANGAEILT